MYVVAVAPILKGLLHEELSIFQKTNVHFETLVIISIKKRNVRAFVLSCVPAEEERHSLRHANFSLKK